MGISSADRELSLLAILPMIQRVVLNCWNREDFPYTKSQFIIFTVLQQHESLTMKEVASFISSSKEQATRVVAPLVDDGLAERYIDQKNRNYIHIRLTEEGRKYIQNQREKLHQNLEQLLAATLTEEERQALFDSLHTAVGILEKVR